MAFRALIGLIVPLIISMACWADDIKLNPSHPQQYTVVKGDTLWSISAKFLKNPWQWRQIWKANTQIQNPDLIFPGDVVTFSVVDGKPQLAVSGQADANGNILYPHSRNSELTEAITVIPVDAIAPFLAMPRVVSEHELNNAPYVIGFAGEHLIAGSGDKVYVRAITHPKNLGFTVFRKGNIFAHPETGEILGYEAEYIADTMLQKTGDPATLLITKSDGEIREGDRLMPLEQGQVALNYFPRPPEKQISGSIISVLSGVTQIGTHNIVTIDKGTADGIESGHVLEIFQRGRTTRDRYEKRSTTLVKLPDEKAGTLMVFRTFERISYALVMEATGAIHILDYVETP